MALKPRFTHQILNRLVTGGSANPFPERAPLFFGRDSIRLHVEAKPFRADRRGNQHLGADPRRIDLLCFQMRPDPLEKPASRP